jgi:hypothetical protein
MRSRLITLAVCAVLVVVGTTLAACGPDASKELMSQRPAAATATPTPAAAPVKLFDLGNVYGVTPGAKATVFTLDNAATVTEIMTYHYIIGGGPTPGAIALKAADGTLYGPWPTTGLDGQGKVKNAYWDAKPNAQIPAGTYTVIDSDPKTWSTNERANGLGFVTVLGNYAP